MSPKLQLPVPKRGLSDDTARAEQPPLTTRFARNVRVIDPSTGRSRIAQRGGTRKFWTTPMASRIDAVAVVPYNAPKIQFAQLEPPVAEEWTADLGVLGRAVRVDFQGSLYAFLEDGRISVWNRDGELLDTISPPLKPGEIVERAIAVDEGRRLFAATYGGPEVASRIFMWVRVEDPEREDFTYYDLKWTHEVEGKVREIIASAGSLWAVRTQSEGGSLSHITKYGGLLSTTGPFVEWDTGAPHPVSDIALGAEGAIYITSPANANRGAQPSLGGLHSPVTSWTPHDIGYDAGDNTALAGSVYRLHSWVDARHCLPFVDHAFVVEVQDRRYVLSGNTDPGGGQPPGSDEAPAEYFDGPADHSSRPLFTTKNTDPTQRVGPQLWLTAVAGQPGLLFEKTWDEDGTGFPGMCLRSNINTGPKFKSDTTGDQTLSTETDATSVTLAAGGAWVAVTGISHNTGVLTEGVLRASFTAQMTSTDPTTVPAIVEVRVTRDGAPAGAAVVWYITGEEVVSGDLPINGFLGGIYGVEARAVSPANAVIIEGTATTTTVAFIYNDSLPDHDGLATQQRAIIPGHQGAGGHGDSWTWVSSWELHDSTDIGVMAYQKGNSHQWALLSNARVDSGHVAHAPGWITFVSSRMLAGSSVAIQIPGAPPNITWRAVSGDTDPDGDESGFKQAVVTVQCVRSLGGTTGDAHLQSFFRVNGRASGNFTIDGIEAWGANSRVVLGNKHRLSTPDPAGDLFSPETPFGPFDGFFLQSQVLLGSTSDTAATANDVPSTSPTSGGTPIASGDSGSIDPTGWNDDPPDEGTSYTGSATEVERLEGGMAHDYGLANRFPNGTLGSGPPFADHPFGGFGAPPSGFSETLTIDDVQAALNSPRPILAKLSGSGSSYTWALNGSGLGYGVVALPDRYLATVGERDPFDVGSEDVVLRRIFDGGQTYSTAPADGAWVYEDGALAIGGFTQPRLVADDAGQVYWPIPQTRTLQKHRGSDGTLLWEYTPASPIELHQVALDPDTPLWPDSSDEEDRGPIFAYIVGTGLRKLRMVSETQVIGDSASPRLHRYIAVAGGTMNSGAPGSAGATVTGGTGLFDATRTYLSHCTLFGKHYLTDGRNYVVYDPLTDTAEPLVSKVRGEMPKRARIFAAFLGQLLMTHTQDDASTLFASAQGDPTDFDYFPENRSATDAWNTTIGIGEWSIPDIITSLIVLDEVLLIGCDHSIFKMVGNPLAGGRIDLVSDETGIAFGSAWCKDTDGRVYFFGQRGGVWVCTRGLDNLLTAKRISSDFIERRLQAVNLSTHRIAMAWDYKAEGLMVRPITYTA